MGVGDKLKAILATGVTPEKLALTVAFGVTCGVFPIPGVTTVPVVIAIWLFALNPAGAYAVNIACTPLNIATVVPFIRAGEYMLQQEPVEVGSLLDDFKADFRGAFGKFGWSVAYGCAAWAAFLPFGTALLYVILLPVLRKVVPADAGAAKKADDGDNEGKAKAKPALHRSVTATTDMKASDEGEENSNEASKPKITKISRTVTATTDVLSDLAADGDGDSQPQEDEDEDEDEDEEAKTLASDEDDNNNDDDDDDDDDSDDDDDDDDGGIASRVRRRRTRRAD